MKLLLILLLSASVAAEDVKKNRPVKKGAAKPAAHAKATPEQIRRFNELQKQQKK